MKKIDLKYPWCTGAPRPTLVANQDAEEAIVSYYTAPICEQLCKTAVIKINGVSSAESHYLSDENNEFLKSGLMRDSLYVKNENNKNKYVLLFNNEYIVIIGDSIEEHPGDVSFLKNINNFHSNEYERE